MSNGSSTLGRSGPPLSSPDRVPVRFTALPQGTQLRHYIVHEVLGAGGFGITYRVEHITLRNKSFALKEFFPRDFAYREGTTVKPTADGSELCGFGLKRFLQEAETLAICTHPAIVDVVDYFEANGTAYATLEYVQGMPFGTWLTQLRRPPTQAELDVIVQPLLDAIEVVHSHKMLHRDIAPDNILIRPDGMPCLIDFGAARSEMGERAERTAAIVKFGYSPPEQHLGDAIRQGPWTDIYAMGATLYRAVTGKRPPDSMRRLNGSVTMPPMASHLVSHYRPGFLNAINQALELEIGARPQSVSAWRAALMDDDRHVPAVGPKPDTSSDAHSKHASTVADRKSALHGSDIRTVVPRSKGHRPGRQIIVGLAAISALAGALSWRYGAARPNATHPIDPVPAVSVPASTNEQTASALPIVPTVPASEMPLPQPALPASARPPGHSVETPSTPQPAGADRIGAKSQTAEDCASNEPDRKLAACLTLVLSTPPTDVRALYLAHVELGRARRLKRDGQGALQAYDDAIALSPDAPEAFNHRGITRTDQRQWEQAVKDFSQAIERRGDYAEALNNRAWVLLQLGRAAQGLEDANAAVGLLPDKAYVWNTRGQIHERLGNRQQAIDDYRKSLDVDPVHQPSFQSLQRLGVNR